MSIESAKNKNTEQEKIRQISDLIGRMRADAVLMADYLGVISTRTDRATMAIEHGDIEKAIREFGEGEKAWNSISELF